MCFRLMRLFHLFGVPHIGSHLMRTFVGTFFSRVGFFTRVGGVQGLADPVIFVANILWNLAYLSIEPSALCMRAAYLAQQCSVAPCVFVFW